jgi:HEAT repeat protein
MINKRRQELLINNLNSISAEVRINSLQQLISLPAISKEDKIAFARKAMQDSDEDVRNNAAVIMQKLGQQVQGTEPETVSPDSTPEQLPNIPENESPDQKPGVTRPGQNNSPNFSNADKGIGAVEPQNQGQQPALPSLEPDAEPAVAQPRAQQQTDIPSGPPQLNDPVDSSLPDLKKMSDIPALLQHIKTLTKNKPSGHLSQLLQLARGVQEEVALAALQALLNLKDKRVPSQVLFMLSNDNFSSQRRFMMLKIIMDTDVSLDVGLLERILVNEDDVIVKSGLVKVFARNSKEKGVKTLQECLKDSDPRVRANTVEVIEEQGISGCEEQILELLHDSENRVKVNAAKFLVKNGYQQAFLTLRSMLVSSEVWLRDSVIFALGEIADQASLTLLKAALKDPNQGIRLSVLKSLAKINNYTARQVLKAASGDPDPVVAQVATSLWEKIKDTPLREDVKIPPKTQQPAAPTPPAASPPPPQPAAPTPPAASPPPPQPAAPTPPAASPPPPQPAAPTPPAASPPPPQPAAPTPPAASPPPPQPAAPTPPAASPPPPQPAAGAEGSPDFAKPRSLEIYKRLCSDNEADWRSAAKDIAFVMGKDQMILVEKAFNHQDDHVRLAAAKILSRKRTPEAKELLQRMVNDSNDLVRSLVNKSMLISK